MIDHLVLLKIKPIYIYFNSQDHDQTRKLVLRNLLKQLLSALPKIPSTIQDAYRKSECGDGQPDCDGWMQFIKAVSTSFSCVAVLLDAFDECTKGEKLNIVEIVRDLQKSGMKVFITTRPHDQSRLETKLVNAISMEIKAREPDIKIFLEANLRSEGVTEKVKDQIMGEICLRAQGMYVPFSCTVVGG